MTINITPEITAEYRRYLDEVIDTDVMGTPIPRRATYPYLGNESCGLVVFAAAWNRCTEIHSKDTTRLDWLLPNLHPATFGLEYDVEVLERDDAGHLAAWRDAIDVDLISQDREPTSTLFGTTERRRKAAKLDTIADAR